MERHANKHFVGTSCFGIRGQEAVLAGPCSNLSQYPYDALWVICPEDTVDLTRQRLNDARGELLPRTLHVQVVPQRQLLEGYFTGGSFGCIPQAVSQCLWEYKAIAGKPRLEEARIALICSGGQGTRATPLSWLGCGNKSLMPSINGKPLLYQILKQIIQIDTAPGVWAFGCDVLQSINGGLQYNANEISVFVNEVGIGYSDTENYLCLSVGDSGRLVRATYQPSRSELNYFGRIAVPLMVTFFPPSCLWTLAHAFFAESSPGGLPLVQRYTIDMVTWFQALTMGRDAFAEKYTLTFGIRDAEAIWDAFQALLQSAEIKFPCCSQGDPSDLLVDVGDIRRYVRTALETARNPALRELLGLESITAKGGTIVKGLGNCLELGDGVRIRGCLVAGGDVRIERGEICDGIVINHKAHELEMAGPCLVAGGTSQCLIVPKGDVTVFTPIEGEMFRITANMALLEASCQAVCCKTGKERSFSALWPCPSGRWLV